MTQTSLTASALWRAEACPASAVLPHTKKVYADAEAGTREHAALEASAPPGSFAEVAFIYNVLSGEAREVGRSIGRNYGLLIEGDIPGTADRIEIGDDRECVNAGAVDLMDFAPCYECDNGGHGYVRVTDFKTGHGYKVSPPAENLQLHHNALCASLVYGKPCAKLEIVFTRTGEVQDGEMDLIDFAATRTRLRAIWTATQAKEPAVNPDPQHQCWRCPAKKACPIMGRK